MKLDDHRRVALMLTSSLARTRDRCASACHDSAGYTFITPALSAVRDYADLSTQGVV